MIEDNPNSPENLLGPWLIMMDDFMFSHRVEDRDTTPPLYAITAHILDFADQKGKLVEMINWLATDDAKEYFKNASSFSSDIYSELVWLISLQDPWAPEDIENQNEFFGFLRGWILEKSQELPHYLELK
jgi:hypothetical protein